MGRPRKPGKDKLNAGGLYDVHLVTAFQYLCTSVGISAAQGIERLMADAILKREIPGVQRIPYEEINKQMPLKSVNSAGKVLYEQPE